jgi:imidazoleglycerol-phosphate dehydratase
VSAARLTPGSGEIRVATGVPVLDHLLTELATAGRFDLTLELEPDEPDVEIDSAGVAFGLAVRPLLAPRAHGTGVMPSAEALAMVVVEAADRPLVASNADLSGAGGLGADLAARFFASLAEAAALTIHVRLMEGESTDHALDAVFKALGVALAEAIQR